MPKRHIAILLANGGHARFLLRDPETEDFHTIATIEDGPWGRSLGPGRSGLDGPVRRRRVQAFISVIAEHLRELVATHTVEGVVVVAPGRMLTDLAEAVAAVCPAASLLSKDMLKVEDHDLARSLSAELLQAEAACELRRNA